MTGTPDDMRDAILDAQADLMDAFREVMRELVVPDIESKARALWAQLPEDMKEQFKQQRPEEYAALMKGMINE